jgi:hypothetical protein
MFVSYMHMQKQAISLFPLNYAFFITDNLSIHLISREVVRSPMVEAQCFVQLAFPVVLKNTMMVSTA